MDTTNLPPNDPRGKILPYSYFVSYAAQGPLTGQFGFGHIEINRSHPIRSGDDVQAMNDYIRSTLTNGQDCVVLNFQLLRGPEA